MTDTMSRDELRAAIDTLWFGNQTRAARDLGIAPRTMRAFLSDTASARPISCDIAREVRELMAQFPTGISEPDPRKTISILQQLMVRAGWPPQAAAAGILGAATANAEAHDAIPAP